MSTTTALLTTTVTCNQGTAGVTAWPVSCALSASSAVIGHVVVDSGTVAIGTGSATIGAVTAPGGGALATSAKQDTGNASLASIDGHITACDTGAVTISAALPAGANTIGAVTAPGAAALALDATLTGGTAKAIARGGAKGATAAADVTSTSIDADHNALDVAVKVSALPSGAATSALQGGGLPSALASDRLKVDGSGVTQPISAAALPLPSGASTSALQGGGLPAALGASGGLKVDGSGTALPVSGTVTANIGTSGSLALEAGHLATIDTSTATTATNTGTTATNTTTLADATLASDVALSGNIVQVGGVGKDTAPTNVTDGRSVRGWLMRSGAFVARLLGADGSTFASASNGVPVIAQTSSTWDVSDRAARILGLLIGADGSTVASEGNPIPIIAGAFENDNQATLAAGGKLLKTGAGTAVYVYYSQTTGNTRYIQIHDSTTTPASNARAVYSSSAIATGTTAGLSLGHSTFGATCKTGVYLVLSTAQFTYTATTDTALAYVIQYK